MRSANNSLTQLQRDELLELNAGNVASLVRTGIGANMASNSVRSRRIWEMDEAWLLSEYSPHLTTRTLIQIRRCFWKYLHVFANQGRRVRSKAIDEGDPAKPLRALVESLQMEICDDNLSGQMLVSFRDDKRKKFNTSAKVDLGKRASKTLIEWLEVALASQRQTSSVAASILKSDLSSVYYPSSDELHGSVGTFFWKQTTEKLIEVILPKSLSENTGAFVSNPCAGEVKQGEIV